METYLNTIEQKPHIIVCTESWDDKQLSLYSLDYSNIYNDSHLNKVDGVVKCLVKNITSATHKRKIGLTIFSTDTVKIINKKCT